MERLLECKNCNYKTPYKALGTNFVVFCPKCKNTIILECEYGYGPVTPCSFHYKENIIANISQNNKNEYILSSTLLHHDIRLESQYLDALKEGTNIIRNLI